MRAGASVEDKLYQVNGIPDVDGIIAVGVGSPARPGRRRAVVENIINQRHGIADIDVPVPVGVSGYIIEGNMHRAVAHCIGVDTVAVTIETIDTISEITGEIGRILKRDDAHRAGVDGYRI